MYWRLILFSSLAAVLFTSISKYFDNPLPLHFDGNIDEGYEKIREVFRHNFEVGWEAEGAAFAVYQKGKLIVDLWGGYADSSAAQKWEKDTLSSILSATKALSSICIAVLVDKGLMNYDSLVSDYWPEFARNGKQNITLAMVLSHQSGLAYLDSVIVDTDQMNSSEYLSKLIENQQPLWPPGTAAGYHAFTFGWILDEIVRRVDYKRRNVAQFFRDEIAKPYGLNLHIGLPLELNHRAAQLSMESYWGILGQICDDFKYLKFISNLIFSKPKFPVKNLLNNVPWLATGNRMTFNNPQLRKLEFSSIGGFGSARDLAKLFSLISEKELIGQKTLDLLQNAQMPNVSDLLMGLRNDKQYGFMYSKRPGNEENYSLFGHSGFGGQYVKVDVENNLAFSYLNIITKAKWNYMYGVARSDMLLFLKFTVALEPYDEHPKISDVTELCALISLADRFLYPKLCQVILTRLQKWVRVKSWSPTADGLCELIALEDRLLCCNLNEAIATHILSKEAIFRQTTEFKLSLVETAYMHKGSSTLILETCIKLCANLELEDLKQLEGKPLGGTMTAIANLVRATHPKKSDPTPYHEDPEGGVGKRYKYFDDLQFSSNDKRYYWVCSTCSRKREATLPLKEIMQKGIHKNLIT